MTPFQAKAQERRKGTRGNSIAPSRQVRLKRAVVTLTHWGKVVGLAALLLSTLGGIAYGGYQAPFLRISEVNVQGTKKLNPKVITEKLRLEGQHILLLDTGKTIKTLQELPQVKSARVERRFPAALTIRIREREPWAIWQVGTTKYLIDDEGFILGTGPSGASLLTIKDLSPEKEEPQKRVDTAAMELALKLDRVLPQELGTKAKEFEYVRHGGLVVVTDNGWRARFGDMEDFDFKIATWKAILGQAAQQKVKVNHVDLRFGYRPFFR